MKIGILTLPLKNNYGGILQCYALTLVLKRFNQQPIVLSRDFRKYENKGLNYIYLLAKYIQHVFENRTFVSPSDYRKLLYISHNTNYFINKYINPRSPVFFTTKELSDFVHAEGLNAFVVGSDQCWRPSYSSCITNYFLDFIFQDNCEYKRVAYAASFGVDKWEFSQKQTESCSNLIKLFNGISVREDSAIFLCKKFMGVEAEQVLDPTMLLEKQDYEDLVLKEQEPCSLGDLFYYVLDPTSAKDKLINDIAKSCSLVPFTAMPTKPYTFHNMLSNLEDCVYPSVTQWLRAFMDAKMVLTDSFHGCVFSIIFNKPFWVIGNEGRGFARFSSLLKMFRLENRLVSVDAVDSNDWNSPIDWDEVNKIRNEWCLKSKSFLLRNLSIK